MLQAEPFLSSREKYWISSFEIEKTHLVLAFGMGRHTVEREQQVVLYIWNWELVTVKCIYSIERVGDTASGTGLKVLKAELSDMLAFVASFYLQLRSTELDVR